MRFIEYGLAFGVGTAAYTGIEILWRGYTHWSMSLTGGLCLALLYMWNGVMSTSPVVVKALVGALSITAVEFAVGCVLNLALHKGIWDYSSCRFNLLGQICPSYAAAWFALSVPAFYVCDLIKRLLY